MVYKYVCSEAGFNCETVIQDERDERGRRLAEEHLYQDHPNEAIEKDKARGYIIMGSKLG